MSIVETRVVTIQRYEFRCPDHGQGVPVAEVQKLIEIAREAYRVTHGPGVKLPDDWLRFQPDGEGVTASFEAKVESEGSTPRAGADEQVYGMGVIPDHLAHLLDGKGVRSFLDVSRLVSRAKFRQLYGATEEQAERLDAELTKRGLWWKQETA